jgi:hypothetical protein
MLQGNLGKPSSLANPALTIFFLPNLLELLYELNGDLFLAKVTAGFHDHRDAVPVG